MRITDGADRANDAEDPSDPPEQATVAITTVSTKLERTEETVTITLRACLRAQARDHSDLRKPSQELGSSRTMKTRQKENRDKGNDCNDINSEWNDQRSRTDG